MSNRLNGLVLYCEDSRLQVESRRYRVAPAQLVWGEVRWRDLSHLNQSAVPAGAWRSDAAHVVAISLLMRLWLVLTSCFGGKRKSYRFQVIKLQ